MNDHNNKTVDGYVDASLGFKVNGAAPSGKVLTGNGTTFIPQDPPDGGGTVTNVALSMPGIFSVANSPVTSSGTLTVTFATQTSNQVLAGPTTGSAAAPTFRSLVEADIPSLSWSKISKTGSNLTDLATREFADLQNKPTTRAGYGITDAASDTHTHSFSSLTSKPTTLAGYGITDAASDTHTHSFASLTSKPTTLSGYGITDAAPSSHVGSGGTAHANATTSVAGFMSSTDKSKMDGIDAEANNYSHPNHSGDVTSAGDGATTIAARAVTVAKMQAIATARLLGRTTSGSGDIEQITVGSGLSLSGGELSATGGGGGSETGVYHVSTDDYVGPPTQPDPNKWIGIQLGDNSESVVYLAVYAP